MCGVVRDGACEAYFEAYGLHFKAFELFCEDGAGLGVDEFVGAQDGGGEGVCDLGNGGGVDGGGIGRVVAGDCAAGGGGEDVGADYETELWRKVEE